MILQAEDGNTLTPAEGAAIAESAGQVEGIGQATVVASTNQLIAVQALYSEGSTPQSQSAAVTDLRAISAPDGTVTIVFSDIESSTALLERLGDTEFMQMLAWHDRIVRTTAEEHRGFVVKSEGDGFMLAFPSAASALRAASRATRWDTSATRRPSGSTWLGRRGPRAWPWRRCA